MIPFFKELKDLNEQMKQLETEKETYENSIKDILLIFDENIFDFLDSLLQIDLSLHLILYFPVLLYSLVKKIVLVKVESLKQERVTKNEKLKKLEEEIED